ncbi:MAG: T9SS type A sorting domain-containing protein [Cyclobacteriaceae bacterium]
MTASSTLSNLIIRAGVKLRFGSNSKLLLPSGASVTLENGAVVEAANNSKGTLIEIGGNGIWGRNCTGCSNTALTGPGTMDENSNPADPLPVELMFFNAGMTSGGVELQWATASETNNSHFIIERASSDLNFTEIGRRTGAGDSDVIFNYRFNDSSPLTGTSYYRLVQVDYDGTETISRAVAIHSSFTNAGINVFPNPSSTGTISLEYYHPEVHKLQVTYVDATGRTVYTEEVSEPVGERIELGKNLNLDRGMYEVRIQLDNLVYVKRLLVN